MADEIKYGRLTKNQLAAFLDHVLLARLATAVRSKEDASFFQPHLTAVWYLWEGESLYISAFSSTRKLKEVLRNPYIAVLIDAPEAIDGISAVLMEGRSECIDTPEFVQEMSRKIYTRYMGPEGVLAPDPQSWIVDSENRIIKLTPAKVYTW